MIVPHEILKRVRQIEIRTRSLVENIFSGEYHSVFKGRGMEFAEVREYAYGDDIRFVDWNVTARRGAPHVKVFQEERELTAMLVVDASGSGEFGSTGSFKGELAVELAALLAFSAIKNNDRVGLLMFTDRVEKWVPPAKGKKHVLRVIRELLYFRPQHRRTSIETALTHLNRVLRRKSIVFLISDFQDRGFEKPLSVTSRRHELVAIPISDIREQTLPPVGLMELEDPETGQTMVIDTYDRAFRQAFEERARAERQELLETLKRRGIDHVPLTTGQDYVAPLRQFFVTRAKRA